MGELQSLAGPPERRKKKLKDAERARTGCGVQVKGELRSIKAIQSNPVAKAKRIKFLVRRENTCRPGQDFRTYDVQKLRQLPAIIDVGIAYIHMT